MKWINVDYNNLPEHRLNPYFVRMGTDGVLANGTLWPEKFKQWHVKQYLDESEETTDFDSMRVQQAKERIVYKEALEKIVQHFKDHGWKSHEAMNIANEALART